MENREFARILAETAEHHDEIDAKRSRSALKDAEEQLKKLHAARLIMPLGEALHVVREVAQALHHAYWSTDMTGKRLSVVHRDVSPANIIVGFDGTVKLLDFGVAMSAGDSEAVATW